MMWIKQLFCRHKPEWTLRPPTTRLYGDPNYDGWVCKKCGKEVWKGRGYINFTATQLKRDHEIWMSKPVPDYVPACEDPVWHGMFEDLWKSNIEYAATKKTLSGEREKSAQLEKQIKKFKATEHAGMEWEAELRVALGIAGPHTKTVKIIDRVKEICTAKAWAQYEPEIRAKERERIFRKLTNVHIGGIQRGFTMRQGVMIHELEFTEQALSDFLSGD